MGEEINGRTETDRSEGTQGRSGRREPRDGNPRTEEGPVIPTDTDRDVTSNDPNGPLLGPDVRDRTSIVGERTDRVTPSFLS